MSDDDALKVLAGLAVGAVVVWGGLIAYWFWETTNGRDEQ